MSWLVMPSILAAKDPKEKLNLWKALYSRGARTGPPAALLATGTLAYVSYLATSPATRRFYIIAAIMPALIVPYTWLFIDSTNMFLHERKTAFDNHEEVRPEDNRRITDALNKWRDLNYVRTFMPFVATVMAVIGLTRNKAVSI